MCALASKEFHLIYVGLEQWNNNQQFSKFAHIWKFAETFYELLKISKGRVMFTIYQYTQDTTVEDTSNGSVAILLIMHWALVSCF